MFNYSERSFLGHLLLVVCFIVFFFLFTLQTTHAQSFIGGSTGVSLKTNPRFPGAFETVEISLDDYQLDTTGASIAWFVDSAEQTAFRNARSIRITTGALGKKSVVSVTLTRNNTPNLTSSVTLIPTEVHVILETNTYVPAFYKGRALPSVSSPVRAIVVVQDGTNAPPASYTYTWSEESTVLFGGPIKGKSSYDFLMPRYGSKRLFVEVFDATGKEVGGGNVTLSASAPELHFYEQSPLRGLSEKEIVNPLPFIGEETTLYGEPYFINTTMNTNSADFVWKINGVQTAPNTEKPNAITLQKTGGAGESRIDFSITTRQRIPQFMSDAFNLVF